MKVISTGTLSPRTVLGVLLAITSPLSLSGQVIPPPASPEDPSGETGVYLVTFEPGTAPSEGAAAVASSGAVLRRTFVSSNSVSVRVPDREALARLRNHPRVRSVFENRTIRLALQPVQEKGQGGAGAGNGGGGGNDGGAGGGGPKPKAPQALAATAGSATEVALSWADMSSNEDRFVIERCIGSGCTDFSGLVDVAADTTGYLDSGLVPETLHRYRVMAMNTAGSSKYSNVAEASTGALPLDPPAAPSNLVAEAVSLVSMQANLDWQDNSGNEDGFQVERCEGSMSGCADTDFVRIIELGANVTAFSDFAVEADVTYTYRLRAFNAVGLSAYSNLSEATIPPAGPSTQILPTGVWRIGAAPGTLSVTGVGVGIAVIDTGLDFNHPDLGLEPEVIGVNAFNAFGGSCQDFHGHGTHVGGTIAAQNNTVDVVGVAHEATLYCVGVFTNDPVEGVVATDESLIAGVDWILANADIVDPPILVANMSLGRPRTSEDDDPNHPLRQAIAALHAKGISIAVAAGNDPLREVSGEVPASYTEVMAVAGATAIDGANGYDEFFGPCAGLDNIKRDTASFFSTDGAYAAGTGVTVSAPGDAQENLFSYLDAC